MFLRQIFLSAFFLCQFFTSCYKDSAISPEENLLIKAGKTTYLTENVVIVVIDGPRFSETWGDDSKQYIPNLSAHLAPEGVVYNNFFNNGVTNTTPGHTAITTGIYQEINNSGREYPASPSIFQLYLNQVGKPPEKAAIITGKNKLDVLSDCIDPKWRGKFNPFSDAKNRSDRETYHRALEIFDKYQPNLALVHFRGPDVFGHQGNWKNYIASIQETDLLLKKLWDYLQQDPDYQGCTTLFLTNDHGRHSDHVATDFKGHGDGCKGCRHINFFAIGPDFKQGAIINQKRGQIDIPPTVAHLMGFSMPGTSGAVMSELFINEGAK